MGFNNVFGGSAVKPSQVQFEAITMAVNTTLFWPTETQAGQTYVAAQMNVTATATSLSLVMPDATQGSPGVATLVVNVGANAFNLTTNTGGLIATIAPGIAWLISLTSNGTIAGSWQAIQLAATTSNAQAAALAGGGLQAISTQLQLAYPSVTLGSNASINASYRANAVVWSGGAGTLTLDTITNLTAGWWCYFTNEGAGDVAIVTTGGATINGQPSFTIPKSTVSGQYYSCLVVCTAGGFHVFAAAPSVIQVANGGTGASDADTALSNLGGSAIGITIFTAPTAAAILAALGIAVSSITELTIFVDTVVGTSSVGTAYVCITPLTLTLPITTSLTPSFYILVSALGGAVTIAPNGADSISGLAPGANYVIPLGGSVFMTTDSSGNWFPFFTNNGNQLQWAVAAGTAQAITATYQPQIIALVDGLLLGLRASNANTAADPTFSPNGAPAHTITKLGGAPLVAGDIPGNLAECLLRYNLANTRWELLNPYFVNPPWIVATGSADAIAAAYATPIVTLYDGLLLSFRASAANATTTPTFSPNGLTPHTITKQGGVALVAGDIAANLAEYLVRYNLSSTRWELLNPTYTTPLAAQAAQGIVFSLTGAAISILSSFPPGAAGPTAVWNSTGSVTVTLGTKPLSAGYCDSQATKTAQDHGVVGCPPASAMSAGGAYTILFRIADTAALIDADHVIVRFY